MSSATDLDYLHGHRSKGVFLVLSAGLFWSFAGLAIRLIEQAAEWSILFHRSVALTVFLVTYILVFRRGKVRQTFQRSGLLAVSAGFVLALAFCCWIFSLTHTTVANALFLLSTSAFIAAILGWFILKERVPPSTWFFIFIATAGVGVMVYEGFQTGTLFGSVMGLGAATGFAMFAVLIRKGKSNDLITAVFWAGFFAAIISGTILLMTGQGYGIILNDWLLCAAMGVFQIGLGIIIFIHGAKYLPAAEITLLSLSEVVLGPFWVWLVIREIPGALTLVGGAIVLGAIGGQAIRTIRRT